MTYRRIRVDAERFTYGRECVSLKLGNFQFRKAARQWQARRLPNPTLAAVWYRCLRGHDFWPEGFVSRGFPIYATCTHFNLTQT